MPAELDDRIPLSVKEIYDISNKNRKINKIRKKKES